MCAKEGLDGLGKRNTSANLIKMRKVETQKYFSHVVLKTGDKRPIKKPPSVIPQQSRRGKQGVGKRKGRDR